MKQSSMVKRGVAAHVLLVDDNRDGLLARTAVLEELGFIVTTAVNGEEGLETLSKGKFELMVTDFKMPKMDGIELIRRVRPLQPDLRIILLSGFAEALGLNEKSTGADAVISKGVHEIANLTRSISHLLARNPARRPPGAQNAARIKTKTKSA